MCLLTLSLELGLFCVQKLFTSYCEISVVTYKEAINLYKKKHSGNVKSSYIADILHAHGKTKRKAVSRKGDFKYPCPKDVRPSLEKVLKELEMI